MRGRIVAVVAGLLMVPTASASADAGPPYVDHTEWVSYNGQPEMLSLRVYPTPAARAAGARAGVLADADPAAQEAWREVLASAPDADTPGMREQFLCHWRFAEFARPGKLSWNLEPWRPVVDDVVMVGSNCNPGAAEETF